VTPLSPFGVDQQALLNRDCRVFDWHLVAEALILIDQCIASDTLVFGREVFGKYPTK
jgi:hypothetical protein